ncbi:EAL domain-containing protein [Roseomonas sp. NAR14]|uniref:EAL domain-containing protein n=1 Tax=Roseomonas acroporae TaxID=2937791 RepID=A0A9X1Y7X8_9PROT|nr:EAL domain-containing protein [Roseomonas acroporae]MCK8785151.1 EAL domain-containing protein [Roseomonas acroporae]
MIAPSPSTATPAAPTGQEPAGGAGGAAWRGVDRLLAMAGGLLDWLATTAGADTPALRGRLLGMLAGKHMALVFGVANVMFLAAIAWLRLGAPWAVAWLLVNPIHPLAQRHSILLLQQGLAGAAHPGAEPDRAVVRRILAGGLFWAATMGLGCYACVASGDVLLAALAGIHVAGISAGIAARSANVPRHATAQILICGLPYMAGCLVTPLPGFWIMAIEVPACLAAMVSLTRYQSRHIVTLMRAEERNRFLASHDGLTGLPNRSQLYGRLRDLLDTERRSPPAPAHRTAVLYLDLDGFKAVNDTLGHASGDALLQAVAERLRGQVRETDMVARLGGDEFVVLLCGVGPEQVEATAWRLIEAVSQPYEIGHAEPVRVGVSVGSALSVAGTSPERLIVQADQALYAAKRDGRGVHRSGPTRERPGLPVAPAVPASAPAARFQADDFEATLRRALSAGHVVLYYQPLRDCRSGRIVGAEALLRWTDPDQGPIRTGDMVRQAEESGAIRMLGEWALRTACAEAAGWRYPIRLGVNLSPVQVQVPGFAARVEAILRAVGFPAERLTLELTESWRLDLSDSVLATLNRLRELGTTLSLDDFGNGYSNMAYLKDLPISAFKIDRAFVPTGPEDGRRLAITRSLVELGHALDLSVVAEGVETLPQLHVLQQLGCDLVQGYLLGPPLPAESLRMQLEEARPAAFATGS